MIPNSLTPSTAFRRLNLNRAFAVKAALAYLLMGSAWILATSRLVDRFTQDPKLDDLAELVSNGLLVGATALSLGLVLDFCFRRMERSTRLLQEAEERWRHALEGACEGVWDWNAQTNEVFYSPEWKGMLGFGPQEIGNTFVEWESRVHPDDLPEALAMVKRHLEGQSPFYLSEHRIRCKDGTFKWILARGKVVAWTSEGKPLHVRGTHSDISEQKRAEESLRQRLELQDQLAKVAASVPGLICSFKLHPDGSVSMPFATAAIADLYGVQPEDVREDFSSVLNRVHPDDRDHLHKGIQESARSMEPWHDVFRIQHPSKGERWVDGHSVPRLEPDGSILWHGFVQDITVPTLAAISLRRQEERLRLALDAAEMVTWELDIPSGRLTYSSNLAALAGSEAIGQHLSLETFLDQVHPDDRAATQDAIQAAIQEGKLFNSEYRVRLPDGSWQWLAGRGRTIAGPDGACRQVIGVSQDITQRKCAEEALRASESRFRTLVDNATDALCVSDLGGRILDVNRQACASLGYSREELLAMNVIEIDAGWNLASAQRAWSEFRPGSSAVLPGLHRRKDGTLFPVEVHAGCFEADGQVRLLGLARDMTERQKMEEERAVALAKYRSLFDTLPVGVMIADNAGLIVESNRFVQQLLGVTAAELVGRAINDPEWKILRPDGSPMPPEEYASVRALREQRFIENTEKGLVRRTGEIVWISVTAAPLIAPNLGVVIVYSDVSARRHAAESLLRSEEKYRIVADNTFDWEFWLSPAGQYIYTSNSCERITGCRPAEFEADPSLMARLVHPEDFDRFIAHQCVSLRGQLEPEQEFRIIRPDREVRWIGHVCQPVRDQAGTFLGVRGSNRDITERKRAQDRLMSLNQCLLAFSPDSAENINNLVRFLGEKLGAACAFYVRLENERLHTVGGWNKPPGFVEPEDPQASICLDVIRKADSAPIFIRDHAAAASPFRDPNFARHGLRAYLGAAVRVGESSAGALCVYYHDDREPDSSDVDLLGIVASAVGAEEKRKQAEAAFASEAARRQVLVDGSRDGIVFLDSEGRVVEANQRFAESLGYTAEEIQALHVWDWDRDWPRDRVLQSIRELGPEGSHFESRHWRKDGSCFDVIVSNSAAEVQGEKLVFCVCHDITELKQAESLLKESLLFRREAEAIARIGAWKINPETGYLDATEGIHAIAETSDDYSPSLEQALQLFDPDSIPEIRAALLQAWQEGAPFVLETGFNTVQGRHLWVEVRGLGRIEAASGAHVIGTFQDITERKRREKLNQLRFHTLELLATHAPLSDVLASVVFQLECEHEDWIGSIMLVDEGRARLVNGAAPRLPESFLVAVDGLAVAVGNGSCGTAAATGEVVIVEDIATHPYWVNFRELALEAGLRACWSIPISSAQGQVLGALAVYHRRCCVPTPEDLKAIQVVLDLARIAVSKLQAEEQLREREELFSSIVNQAGDAITVVDSITGKFTQFNAAACQGLGYSKEEFAGLRVTDIQAEHSPEAVLENNVSALQLGGLNFETRHRHRDGSLRDVRVSLRPLQIRKRDFVAAVWTDITEAKRAETRAAGERRRTAFLLDLHQRAPQLTDRELYRHVLEQAVGLTESSGGVLRLTSHDQPVVTLTQGSPGDSEARLGDWIQGLPVWGSTIRNVPSDLSAQPAFQRFMSVPVTQGLQDRMTLVVWDKELAYDEADLAQLQVAANELHKIMAQRAAQNLLRHSEQRFRHLVETTFDWIWEVDAAGCYTYASPKVLDLLGYAPEEVLGRTPFDLMPSAEARRVAAIFGEISAKREPFSGLENRNLHRSGREVVLETSGVPVLSDHGELLGYRGMDRDVTDRKRLESQLRQAQKLEAIGQLAGGVAHDFNNILAAILMQLGLIQMSPLLDSEINDAVCELEKGAQRAASLTRQLLMFSRRSVLDVKALDLNVVVANLLKMLGRLIGEDVKLVFEGHTGLPSVRADAGMLDQVLMNLVVNARDAMPRGGRIAITTDVVTISEEQVRQNANREAGRFVRLGVADTGCGMSKEVQDRIFEPFFTTKEPGKGTGLGLATVHGIVAQHQGWIEVESEPGRGATFLVFLPALDLPLAESNGDARSRPLVRGQEVVLLVEDETDLRRAAGQTLRALGYRVYEAENGQQAMILWQKHGSSIDLLLTDMVMPEGMTGLELAERLHEMKPALRIIISSGYSTEIFQAGGIKQAGVWYLPKPYETHTLADAIRACFDRQNDEGRKGPPDAPENV